MATVSTAKAAQRYYEMYVIIQTQYFCGHKYQTLWEDDISGRTARFATAREAQDYIKGLRRNIYYYAAGEYRRPTYRACRIDRLPQNLAETLH
jgi:hypothetical protein